MRSVKVNHLHFIFQAALTAQRKKILSVTGNLLGRAEQHWITGLETGSQKNAQKINPSNDPRQYSEKRVVLQ